MEALWRSKCPACDEWIEEGDTIAKEDGEWIHEDCAEEPDEWDWDEW